MAVNYADFRDIAIEDYDAVVVGSGFAGAVSARQLAEEGGLRVLVIEKRAHIAGNMYDEYDEAGVLVHRYGPHIFHTNDQRAYDYLARFTEWSSYQHRVLADWYGTYMPVPFNKNSMEIAFGDEKAARLIEKLVDTFGDERKVTINELRAQEDPELQEVADFVYQNVFLYYTQKQWGLTPEEVDPSVTARVPVFISRDNRYFQDAFQGMPVDGYTRLFENLLGHEKITVCLSTEAESVFDLVFAGREEDAPLEAIHIKGVPFAGPIVYTGPLDELFLGRFGRLALPLPRFRLRDLRRDLPLALRHRELHGDRGLHSHHGVQVAHGADRRQDHHHARVLPGLRGSGDADSLLRHHQRRQRRALCALPPPDRCAAELPSAGTFGRVPLLQHGQGGRRRAGRVREDPDGDGRRLGRRARQHARTPRPRRRRRF